MYPILFQLGPVPIHTFGLLHAAAFAVGLWWTGREVERARLDGAPLWDLAGVFFVWSLVGARLFSVLFDGQLMHYMLHPLQILAIWKGGLTYYGGLLFALAGGLRFARARGLDVWRWADAVAPGLALGMAVGRLGCLASGDSYGKPTHLPWGVTFTDPHALAPIGVSLHPTQVYSALLNLVLFAILAWRARRPGFPGQVALVFALLYGVTRSIVEVFRDDPRGVYFDGLVSTSQLASIAVIGAAVWLWSHRAGSAASRPHTGMGAS